MRSVFKLLGLLVALMALLTVITVVIFGAFLLALGFVFGGADAQPSHLSHEVEYSAQVHTNGTLENMTLMLPYPNDRRFMNAVNSNDSNASIHSEFNASLKAVNTSRGTYLQIQAENFRPKEHTEGMPQLNESKLPEETEIVEVNRTGIDRYRRYDISIILDYNRSIDTRNGLTEEPHLRSNSTECREVHTGNCATSKAFLQYETGNNTYLEMDAGIDGRNSWASGFSWSSNSYSQSFYSSYYDREYYVGSQDRWVTLTGSERQGEGTYRD